MNSPASPKSRRNRHLLAVLALLLPAALWVTAQEAAKEIVKEIKIRYIGPVNVDESRIRANLATKVGDEFSVAVVSADIDNLVDSGEVDTVRALREDVA